MNLRVYAYYDDVGFLFDLFARMNLVLALISRPFPNSRRIVLSFIVKFTLVVLILSMRANGYDNYNSKIKEIT